VDVRVEGFEAVAITSPPEPRFDIARECIAAGLRLDTAYGAVMTAGELGAMSPYLPSGAYL